MEHVVEIYDMHGDYIASEKFSVFESSTPIPIPNVGDCIYLPSGCGQDGKQSEDVKVSERQFSYTPKDQANDACVRVELYCKSTSGS